MNCVVRLLACFLVTLFQISAGTPTILTEILQGFPQSRQANAVVALQIK
jgi:hypothetical protein